MRRESIMQGSRLLLPTLVPAIRWGLTSAPWASARPLRQRRAGLSSANKTNKTALLPMLDDVRRPEIRFDVDADDVSVLDGYCQASGEDRATVICRVVGRNPLAPERRRMVGGEPSGMEAK
jgi:hypothetical protein